MTKKPENELSPEAREAWERDGFFILRNFGKPEALKAQYDRVVEIARSEARGEDILPAYSLKEERLISPDRKAEEQISKIFKLHRQEPAFNEFCRDPKLLGLIADLLGPDLDCFLSQFIFKYQGSLGQPWHQDGWYFPFDRAPQIGAWLAITEANEENGPLWVLPGSHREPIHDVVPDQRPGAILGYVEIVDHEMEGAVPVLMQPGDLLIFHSNLMHKSTDHERGALRAAMVFHYSEAGTVDGTLEKWGFPSPNNDFLPVLRDGRVVGTEPAPET